VTLHLLLEEAVTKMVQLPIPNDKCIIRTKLWLVEKKTKYKTGVVIIKPLFHLHSWVFVPDVCPSRFLVGQTGSDSPVN
jgi:hypothetical protein